jgi:hypothetical protein
MAFTNFWREQHDTKYVSTHLMQKNTMAVLPGIWAKVAATKSQPSGVKCFFQTCNHNNPCILFWRWVRRLIFSGTRTRGWGVVVKRRKNRTINVQPPEVPKQLLPFNWFISA